MKPATEIRYGPPAPADIASKSGKEILRTIIEGELPQAPTSESNSLLPAESDYTTIETKADFAWLITRTPADAGRCLRSSDHLKRSKGSRP